jgi:hypothetical protein
MLTTAGAIRSMNARAKREAEAKLIQDILDSFCQNPKIFNLSRRTCDRKTGVALIRKGLVLAWGEGYYAKTKSLGCGVYHIAFERA